MNLTLKRATLQCLVLFAMLVQSSRASSIQVVDVDGHASLRTNGMKVNVTSTAFGVYPSYAEVSVRYGSNLVFDRKIQDQIATKISIIPSSGISNSVVDVQLYSGGAHCCFSDMYIRPSTDAASTDWYTRDWDSYPPKYQRLNGQYMLVGMLGTGYSFGNFGGSSGAVAIYALKDQSIADVTSQFPTALRRDANQRLSDYNLEASTHRTGDASLAAYLADMVRLGEGDSAWARVRRIYAGDDFGSFAQRAREWLRSNGIAER